MGRQTIVLVILGGVLWATFALPARQPLLAQVKPAQQAAPARPDLRPGDKLEVIDMGRVREAEFVEFTPVGLIKVRFDDDSQLPFRPSHVRFAKGFDPSKRKAPAAKERPANAPPAIGATPATSPPEDLKVKRQWQDASGQFSLEAEFTALGDGKVQLKKSDGKTLSIPLEKLAAADQEVAKRLAAAANPFEQNVVEPKPEPVVVKHQAFKLAGAKKLEPIPDVAWSATPDPAPPTRELATTPVFIPVTEPECYGGEAILDPGNGWTWFFMNNVGQRTAHIERVNLVDRKPLPRIPLPIRTRFLEISPTGKWVAVLQNESNSDGSPVEFNLWRVVGQDVQPAVSLVPFNKELRSFFNFNLFRENNRHEIGDATFLDQDRHLFVQTDDAAVMLNLETSQGIYVLQPTLCAFSPGRRYLVAYLWGQRELVMLEALTGRCVGKLDLDGGGEPHCLGFSADGTKLAAASRRNIWQWNLLTGQLERAWHGLEVPLHDVVDRLAFGTHDHLLISGKYFFHLKDGVVSCAIDWPVGFNNVRYLADVGGRNYFSVVRTDPKNQREGTAVVGTTSYQLPGDKLQAAYAASDISDLLVVRPKAKLSVSFDGVPPERIAGFRAGVAAEFARNDWQLTAAGEAADFTVLFSLKDGKPEVFSYVPNYRTEVPVKVTITPEIASVVLKQAGSDAVLWSNSANFRPRESGHLDPDRTTVETASQLTRDWKFFEKTKIPTRLLKYPGNRKSVVGVSVDPNGKLVVHK